MHRLDRIASNLAGRLTKEKDTLVEQLLSPAPFQTKMSQREALAWWTAHRNDEYGARVLANKPAEYVLALDRALAQQIEAERMGELP